MKYLYNFYNDRHRKIKVYFFNPSIMTFLCLVTASIIGFLSYSLLAYLFASSNLSFSGMLVSFFSWPILFAVFFIVAVSAYCIAKYDLFWHDCVKSKYADSGVKNKDYFLFFMWLILALIAHQAKAQQPERTDNFHIQQYLK